MAQLNRKLVSFRSSESKLNEKQATRECLNELFDNNVVEVVLDENHTRFPNTNLYNKAIRMNMNDENCDLFSSIILQNDICKY